MAASAAATVKIKKTKTWPERSFKKCEKAIKLKFTDISNNSVHIMTIMMFLRLITIPVIPIEKTMADNVK